MMSTQLSVMQGGLRDQHAAHLERRARLWRAAVKPKLDAVPLHEPAAADRYAPLNMLCRPGWAFLARYAGVKHGVPFQEIMGNSRATQIVAARHLAIWLVHQHIPHLTIAEVGRLFKRDHTSVLHAFKKFSGTRRRSC